MIEVKDIKKQISIIQISLVNEVRHSRKWTLSVGIPFQHKYPFQTPKNKNPCPLHDIKIQKKVGKKSDEKLSKKAEKESLRSL